MLHPVIQILKVKNILQKEQLTIPDYQRPYSWEKKNVIQLIDDLLFFMEQATKEYRLGNLIIHNDKNDKNALNIVDGQQRLTTLSIILYLLEYNATNNSLLNSSFESDLSINKIIDNKNIIEEKFKNYDSLKKEKLKSFILENCEFVYIELYDLSEAFQLFDSQNARGKALESYDLLKAFHLREMENETENEKLECVKKWEKYIDADKIGNILGNNLYRIRIWSEQNDASYLDKESIDEFKGININQIKQYPYLKSYLLNISLTEDLNKNSLLNSLDFKVDFPFQINQIIINGKYFFKYVYHYSELFDKLFNDKNSKFNNFYKENTNYTGNWRQGDIYVKEMFQAIILTYYDKFGEVEFEKAYKELYKWAYFLRLKQSRVSYLSINKYIRENNQGGKPNNKFYKINKSHHPKQVFKNLTQLPGEIIMDIPKIIAVYEK